MKKIVLSVSVCIVSFILGISLGTLTADRAQQDGVSAGDISAADTEISGILKPQPNVASSETAEAEKVETDRFLLSLSDNGISVYKVLSSGQTEFLYKKEMDAATLRSDDYTRLCTGIMVYSEQEAREIIEDFIS